MNKYWWVVLIGLVLAGIAGYFISSVYKENQINSFQDCVDAGYPVMESFPAQCRTAGGKHFVDVE